MNNPENVKELSTTQLLHRFIPSQNSSNEHLLILAHGRTGNLKLLEFYSKRFKIESLAFLTIQAPFPDRRPEQEEEGFSWYYPGRERIQESRTKLNELLKELEAQGVSRDRIYWLGFSQGAVMGLELALRSEFRLGGFLCISGHVAEIGEFPEAFGPEYKNQKILITHGTRDQIIPFDRIQKEYEHLKELGVPFEFKVYDKPHSFHLKDEVPYLEDTLKTWIKG